MFSEVRSGEQGAKLLLQGSRLLFRAGWNAFLLAGYLSPLLRGNLLRRRLPRNWLHRFRGNRGIHRLNRRRLAIRVNRRDVRIGRFDIRTGGGLLQVR